MINKQTMLEMAVGRKAVDRYRRQEQLDEIARRFAKATPGSNIMWSTYYGDETIFVNHMTVVVRKFGGEEFTLDGGPIGEFPSEQLVAQLCLL
jgi:hypothetical protein